MNLKNLKRFKVASSGIKLIFQTLTELQERCKPRTLFMPTKLVWRFSTDYGFPNTSETKQRISCLVSTE